MKTSRINSTKISLMLIAVMILWSSSLVVSKFLFAFYHPILLISIRMLISLACFAFCFREIKKIQYQKNDWKMILLISVCEPCMFFILESQALFYSTANQICMVSSIAPIITIIAAIIFLKENKLSRKNYLGIITAIAGIILLLYNSENKENKFAINSVLGNSMEIGALICGAVYSIGFKKLSARYSFITLTFIQTLIGTIFFALLSVLTISSATTLVFNAVSIAGALYLGVFVSFLSYLVFNYIISKNSVSNTIVYINLVPLFTIIMSYLLLKESINQTQIYACFIILLGVFYSQKKVDIEEEKVID